MPVERCEKCGGSGRDEASHSGAGDWEGKQCHECWGTGMVEVEEFVADGSDGVVFLKKDEDDDDFEG